jgi:hypothetical protein
MSDTFVHKVYNNLDWQLGDDNRFKVTTAGNATLAGTLTVNNGTSAAGVQSVGFEKLSSAGGGVALAINKQITLLTSTGIHAGTLADGAAVGDIKEIYMVADGGDFTLTPANLEGAATTLTFGDVGDYIKLIFDGTDWCIAQNSGVAVA